VLIAGSDTAADLAVKVACKRESQCFTIAVKEKTGASSFVAGNTVLQSLINGGAQLVGSECTLESQKDFAVKQSYRLVSYNSDGEVLAL